MLQRAARKNRQDGSIETCREGYKTVKKALNKAIRAAKESCRKKLVDLLETDLWGKPYRMVLKTLKGSPPLHTLDKQATLHVIKELFTISDTGVEAPAPASMEGNMCPQEEEIGQAEVAKTVASIKSKKALGPDRIPAKVVKWMVCNASAHIAAVLNRCLKKGVLPGPWKNGRLVLIPKQSGSIDKQGGW